MTHYLIEPLDTQFYRGNFPFDAGVDNYAPTELMPSPRTLYGAIRAAGFSKKNVSFSEPPPEADTDPLLGSFSAKGDLYLKGPVLCMGQNPVTFYLPMPADVVAQEKGTRKLLHFCVPDPTRQLCDKTDVDLAIQKLHVIGRTSTSTLENLHESHMLPHTLLRWYLLQEASVSRSTDSLNSVAQELFATEVRVGMQRMRETRAAKTGHLYAATHSRLRSVAVRGPNYFMRPMGYWVQVDSSRGGNLLTVLGSEGVMRLGGENRPARYKALDDSFPNNWMEKHKEEVVRKVAETGRFKLYLITPGLFEGRWHPFTEDGKRILWKDTARCPEAELRGVAVTGSACYGGWDIQAGKPKALEKAVPAGTVYFLAIYRWDQVQDKEKVAEELFEHFNFRSLCLQGDSHTKWQDAAKEGFGIALMGGWDYVQNG